MIESVIYAALSKAPWIIVLVLLLQALRAKYNSGLNAIPGPALAGYTDLWRFLVVWRRRPELEHIKLHAAYGNLVRIGPRAVSVSDPAAIKIIYGLNAGFVKSDFYPVQQVVAGGRPLRSLFNSTDEKFHAKLRRAVSNAYAMSTLLNFEPLVDSTTDAFITQLEQRFADRPGLDGVCDFGKWLQFYAFDVIGELTFSKRLGFVDKGIDAESIIGNLEWMLDYVSVVGQIPWLDKIFLKNPIRLWLSKHGLLTSKSPIAAFALQRIQERNSEKLASTIPHSRDFLSRFLEAHAKDSSFISQERVTALTVANIFAGSDTTAISLRAIFYYLLKDPAKMAALMAELLAQQREGHFNQEAKFVKWEEVRELPYLGAVIKEALRCHPAVGLTLERVVPEQGITICGQFLPGGTIVGCSPWVIHRSKDIYGPDSHIFRPERWLEADSVHLSEMNSFLFSFGAGSRTCIGKNISYLEMYKVVPAILMNFELEFARPDLKWTLHNAWFVKQEGFKVRLRRRCSQG
ncbi:hypothetical protein ANO11243_071300 [Dothideomycetidae sp. 11243]|nr:hypothetical protein ANO11243_071300 [fungal sp. No.11243]